MMQPFQRGFFCADLSIRYPYRDPTLSITMLVICMLILPLLLMCVIEALRLCKQQFCIRAYLCQLFRTLGFFIAGFMATYMTSELGKHMVGRLRPHFYVACQPRFPDGSSCDDVRQPELVYMEEFYCSNDQLSAKELRELRVSFPSAHSSLSFYTVIFLIFYLEAVWQGRGWSRCLRHFFEFVLSSVACYFALSRIADYWHHWSDVFAGCALGATYAILTAIYVGRLRQQRKVAISEKQPLQQQLQHCCCTLQTKERLLQKADGDCEWKLQAVLPA